MIELIVFILFAAWQVFMAYYLFRRIQELIRRNKKKFCPSDIAGLQLWLKKDKGVYSEVEGMLIPFAIPGHPVKLWKDQSGNGYDLWFG